jgi:hypothetical protein
MIITRGYGYNRRLWGLGVMPVQGAVAVTRQARIDS